MSEKLRFRKQDYENVDLFVGDETVVTNETQKLVIVRKEHKCLTCNDTIKIGSHAVHNKGFCAEESNGIYSAYQCLDCVDEWLGECGYAEIADFCEQQTQEEG